jgi:DNA-binding CsgD family transcriptional regulator
MGTNNPQMLSVHLFSYKKNLDSVYTETNETLARFLGFSKTKKMIGCTDYELPCPASENAEKFRNDDQQVISNQRNLNTIDIYEYTTGLSILLTQKSPCYDNNGNLIGTCGRGVNITQLLSEVSQFVFDNVHPHQKLTKGTYIIGYDDAGIKLSPRQQECLFFLLRGKTAKQIGQQLNLGHRTVESYLETIKTKFNCQNKYELIDHATELGFLDRIPEQLLYQSLLNR